MRRDLESWRKADIECINEEEYKTNRPITKVGRNIVSKKPKDGCTT